MESIVVITCAHCGAQVEKRTREVRRQKKAGQTVFFCTRSHANSYWGSRRVDLLSQSNREHLRSISGVSKRDSFTPFRWFHARVRHRQKDTDLTVEYLKVLWEQQTGRCPLTGWEMRLPVSTIGWTEFSPSNASLDKITPALGYAQGNVRFVALIANYAKGVWTDEAVLDFCRSVATHCGPVGA